MPNYLLFHAHTAQQVTQCRYFLLKYLSLYNLKPPTETTVVVYTHQPVAFEGFTSFLPFFEMRDVAVLPNNAAKTTVLHQFLNRKNGNALYCDAASYPVQPLEPLFESIKKGDLFLHAPHRYPENELSKAFRKFTSLRDHTATSPKTPPTLPVTVWRTAIIGINTQHMELLEKTMQVETPLERSVTIDAAVTKVFSDAGKINSAAPYIFDYSQFKEFSQLLQHFFTKNEEESIPNQVKMLHHIDAAAMQQQKEQFQQLPVLKKWMHTLTGKQWSIKKYESKW